MHAPLVAKQGRLGTRRGRRVGPGRAEPAPLINAWLTIICEDADSISSALFQHSTAPTPNSGPFLWREQMANTSRYIIWARRDAHSPLGPPTILSFGTARCFRSMTRRVLVQNAIGLMPKWVNPTFAIRLSARHSAGAIKLPHDLLGACFVGGC
jgi:hypothetical protein